MRKKYCLLIAAALQIVSCNSQADVFSKINNNGLERINTNGLSYQQQNRFTDSRLNVGHRNSSPIYSPLLNRTVYTTERVIVQGVSRLGDLPQNAGNDVIRIRRQSYSHIERELQQSIRTQFQKFTF